MHFMARLPRLYVPGYPVHVRVRGNDGRDVFRSEGDRIFMHRCLVETAPKCGIAVHAYVFMTNHIHLVATGTGEDSLARLIQRLGRRYVGYFNYLHRRTGTLWEGRYRSSLIESERYLLACHRYVELNPVRAGMVAAPGDHPWSSFHFNALGSKDDLVSSHSLYMELGATELARQAAYRRLCESELPEETVAAIRGATGWVLGSPEFCELLEARTGRRVVRKPRGRPRRKQSMGQSMGSESNDRQPLRLPEGSDAENRL
jgi:putative transposase